MGPGQPTAVLVLGMHRSGTSALTRSLNLRGLDIASHLLPAHASNTTGFWESAELVALHDELLECLNQRWYDFLPLPDAWWKTTTVEPFRQRMLDYLKRDFGSSQLFVIKDPRLCRLLPLWREVLADFGARTQAVLVLRDPWESAASLEVREGMVLPVAHGLQLWLRYSLEAERHSRGLPRCLVTYDDLLVDWRTTHNRIARQLDLTFPRKDPDSQRMIDEFLSSGRRHQRIAAAVSDDGLSAPVRQACNVLAGLAHDPDAADGQRTLDELLRQTEETMAAISPLLTGYQQRARASEQEYQREREARRREAEARDNLKSRLKASLDARRRSEVRHRQVVLEFREENLRQRRKQEEKTAKTPVSPSLASKLMAPLKRAGARILRGRGSPSSPTAAMGLSGEELDCYRHLAAAGLFDQSYYLESHPDVYETGLDPLLHFIRIGAASGYRPNPLFDTRWYLQTYPDVASSGINPLLHYSIHGAAEGRDPDPGFDTLEYLEQHPELRQSGANPLVHYLAFADSAADVRAGKGGTG